MIRFLVTAGHRYTFNSVIDPAKRSREHPVDVGIYERLFGATVLPGGTWVFSDLERLAPWELRLAGEIARLMRQAGPHFRVLNDPARAASRYELLLRLFEHGFNRFRAWRAEDGIPKARYPVFLRLEANHNTPLSDLLHGPDELAAALDRLREEGVARRGLLIIEYQAEPYLPGVFRKFAAYRFGDRIVADHIVHDVTWVAKFGAEEAWAPERYLEEVDFVRDNPHAERLMEAFEIAGIDYGRADYGLVNGEVQVWEINTNPALPNPDISKIGPERHEATIIARDRRLDAIDALDTTGHGPPVTLDSELMQQHQKRQWRGHALIVRE